MSILTYPSTPKPGTVYPTGDEFKTLISDFDSGLEERRKLIRFSKRTFELSYLNNLLTERNILHAFYRNVGAMADEFWYVDFISKAWVDEYVGRGGPLPTLRAVADDGGVQTDETGACNAETANGMTLLPAVPAVNDAYYFLSKTQKDKITVKIGTQGAGTWTIVWEYWNGSAYGALSGVTDGTNGFKAAAGDHDVTFTVPSDEVITSVKGFNGYAIRARVSAYTSITTQPKGSGATVNSKTYDLHGLTCSGVTVYVDGTAKTGGGTDYTFVSGGGAAGADRITFNAYPSVGSLITSDLTGFLRIKGRLNDDKFDDGFISGGALSGFYNIRIKIKEIQW